MGRGEIDAALGQFQAALNIRGSRAGTSQFSSGNHSHRYWQRPCHQGTLGDAIAEMRTAEQLQPTFRLPLQHWHAAFPEGGWGNGGMAGKCSLSRRR